MNNFNINNYLHIEESPKKTIKEILKNIKNIKGIGFAGYSEKKWLEMTLKRLILDSEGDNQNYSYKEEYYEEIEKISEEVFKKCKDYIKKDIHIFLFPTFDKFVIEKMNGVNGFCPWKNTILIFINFTRKWKEQLKETIVHELAHALSSYALPDAPIGHWIILEGIAENFKDFIIKKNQSPWTKSISKQKSLEIFKEIKEKINKNNFKDYSEIFFGTGKYPLWTGYTIGYNLVKEYLKKYEKIDWKIILKENPERILKVSTN